MSFIKLFDPCTAEMAKCLAAFTHLLCSSLESLTKYIFSVCLAFCHQFYGAPELYESMLKYLNIVFTALFTLECILKIIAFGPLVSYQDQMPCCTLQTLDGYFLLHCVSVHTQEEKSLFRRANQPQKSDIWQHRHCTLLIC